jgi:hypothetical protein
VNSGKLVLLDRRSSVDGCGTEDASSPSSQDSYEDYAGIRRDVLLHGSYEDYLREYSSRHSNRSGVVQEMGMVHEMGVVQKMGVVHEMGVVQKMQLAPKEFDAMVEDFLNKKH